MSAYQQQPQQRRVEEEEEPMEEWLDSELEDSPRSNDDISSMFSNSPNAGGSYKPGFHPARPAAVSEAQSVEDVDGDMQSFYGAGFVPRPAAQSSCRLPAKSVGTQRFQDMPVGMVPENSAMGDHGLAAKRIVVRHIQQDSMKKVGMRCQAVLVRGASGNYYVYHLEITSDYYKQKWVVCKRYSEFHRLRKRVLARLAAHKKQRGCVICGQVHRELKELGFPKRVVMFKDPSSLVAKRTAGLEEFIVALCSFLAGDEDLEACQEITATRFAVKEFLLFPLEHEFQHVRSIRQLKYVDPRDVHVDSESCPICLCDWNELDGNQLVLSPCGHFFHEHCINEWYRTRFDCPMCRTIAGQE